MNLSFRRGAAFGLLATMCVLVGCQKPPAEPARAKSPEVVVTKPIAKDVTAYEDFTGRTEATESVTIQALVTGKLDKVYFKDGADVNKGDLLFEIDPESYQAEYERAKATHAQADARLKRLNRDYDRAASQVGKGTVTQEDFDRIAGDRAEAVAAVNVAKANERIAAKNLSDTRIYARFSGRMGRRNIDPGNLVKANETVLGNLVQLDPIYATFDVDELTTLTARRLIEAGKMPSARTTAVTVRVGLADEEGHSRDATINFIDNHLETGTGTLRVRATINNSGLLLSPGMFLRVRFPIGGPKPALLVPEEAVGSDQGQRFLFVLNDKDEVVYRQVKLGPQVDRMRVIDEGLKADERVIVNGLQRVKPGVKVTAKAGGT